MPGHSIDYVKPRFVLPYRRMLKARTKRPSPATRAKPYLAEPLSCVYGEFFRTFFYRKALSADSTYHLDFDSPLFLSWPSPLNCLPAQHYTDGESPKQVFHRSFRYSFFRALWFSAQCKQKANTLTRFIYPFTQPFVPAIGRYDGRLRGWKVCWNVKSGVGCSSLTFSFIPCHVLAS